MVQVRTFNPVAKVTIHKLVGRSAVQGEGSAPVSERFSGTTREIDLTPYLGETGSIHTQRSTREAAGGFAITIPDKAFGESGTLETLYGLVEPMDGVEIRFRHGSMADSGGTDPTKPPLVMRGFVSDVTRIQTMGGDGRPQRAVTITGQDYGKIWQQVQIWYMPGYVVGQWLLSSLRLFERFGVSADTLPAAEFVRQVTTKILDRYLGELLPAGGALPASFDTSRVTVANGVTGLTGPQNHQGAIYQLLRNFLDVGPWNELFIDDSETAAQIVFRPNPTLTVSGDVIMPGATAPEVVEITAADVVSMKLTRSDQHVANFYWVRAPVFDLNSGVNRLLDAVASAGDRETIDLSAYPNTAQKLYGVRMMDVATQMGDDDVSTFQSGLPEREHDQRNIRQVDWIAERRRQLVEQNKDSIVFESGAMQLRGNEKIKPGVTLRLKQGPMTSDYYVVQVTHEFLPFRSFMTNVVVERGTGFVQRIQRGGGADSPYLAEQMEAS